MIIKKIAVGNEKEAFIENSLSDGFNIIYSDDNNKGKTIVIQSLMYALGNEPTFPSSFPYKNYYHYVEFEISSVTYFICRKNDNFILKTPASLIILDNVSELKRYWTKNIFALPKIFKNDMLRIVDPVLFLQLFFIGQDKKATYNIANSGYYNKNDFKNMLFSFCDLDFPLLSNEDTLIVKKEIYELKEKRRTLLKQHKILKSPKKSISYLSSINDRESFGETIKLLDKINDKIAELRRIRNNTATRKIRWEKTLSELNSLNKIISVGELRCLDCNSTSISLITDKKSSYSFDVSNNVMRKKIIESIKEKISAYSEEVEKISISIEKEQENLNKLMSEESVSLESIVMYKSQIFNSSDAELAIKEIDTQLEALTNSLSSNEISENNQNEAKNELIFEIVNLMKEVYGRIDSTSNSKIDDIFTKRDKVFSGSEATIFHLAKLYAIQINTKHNFPLVVDSFRAEDLSTPKEKLVLNLYDKISNQKIFTTTLKTEELSKYNDIPFINSIDYTGHIPSQILTASYNKEFKNLLMNLLVELV